MAGAASGFGAVVVSVGFAVEEEASTGAAAVGVASEAFLFFFLRPKMFLKTALALSTASRALRWSFMLANATGMDSVHEWGGSDMLRRASGDGVGVRGEGVEQRRVQTMAAGSGAGSSRSEPDNINRRQSQAVPPGEGASKARR